MIAKVVQGSGSNLPRTDNPSVSWLQASMGGSIKLGVRQSYILGNQASV